MRKKRFDLCREYGCTRETWSGKSEKDISLRYCVRHSPIAKIQRKDFTKKALAAKAERGLVRVPRMKFAVPLVCVFRPYELIADPIDMSARAVFLTNGICGKKAPRRLTGDRTLPRHPSRFGDPLCTSHAHLADDRHVFPGEEETTLFRDERYEEHERKLLAILGTAP